MNTHVLIQYTMAKYIQTASLYLIPVLGFVVDMVVVCVLLTACVTGCLFSPVLKMLTWFTAPCKKQSLIVTVMWQTNPPVCTKKGIILHFTINIIFNPQLWLFFKQHIWSDTVTVQVVQLWFTIFSRSAVSLFIWRFLPFCEHIKRLNSQELLYLLLFVNFARLF